MRCSAVASAEPLAGTAPLARWWWLIEMPGSWGKRALEECRVPVIRALASTPERRVLLVRRRGRHPASDPTSPLRVWIAGGLAGDPPTRLAVVDDHEALLGWPASGPAGGGARPDPHAPVLAVCTNSARDLCCGLDGRALVQDLDDDRAWECSHLGGHRFAPTALLVGEGLVYGRLTTPVARGLLDNGPSPASASSLRGRSGLPPVAQAAEAYLMGRSVTSRLGDPVIDESKSVRTIVTFPGHSPLHLSRTTGTPRPASCGTEPEEWSGWRVLEPA